MTAKVGPSTEAPRTPERDAKGRILPGEGRRLRRSPGRGKAKKKAPRLLGTLKPQGPAYQRAVRWRGMLLKQLGGSLTVQRLALVDQAAITKSALDNLNKWLLENQDA